jgi:hypothetical protein
MPSPKPQKVQPPRRPSPEELRFAFRIRLVERSADVVTALIKWGSLLGCAYCGYRAIASLAGKETFAQILVSFMANMTINKWLAYAFGSGGVLYGLNERRLRRNAVRRLAPGRIQYEQGLDPERSSSGLTQTGETNPEER